MQNSPFQHFRNPIMPQSCAKIIIVRFFYANEKFKKNASIGLALASECFRVTRVGTIFPILSRVTRLYLSLPLFQN